MTSTNQRQFESIFGRIPQISDIKPSVWAEKHVVIPGKGPLDYDFNPYCREIVDFFAPDHPGRKLAVMKGSQITFSSGVLMPVVGWIIDQRPGNTYLTVGRPDLVKPAAAKLDLLIDGAGLRGHIADQSKRKIRNKSGDTDEFKYFAGGYVRLSAITDTKSVAQVDLNTILLDDFEALKGNSGETGNFLDLIEMRAASNAFNYKLAMISTPLLKATSNIEPAYLNGDQRRYNVHCPHCHKPITWEWHVPIDDKNSAGMVWKKNKLGQVDKASVEYVCQLCGKAHKDTKKQYQLREGVWVPTATPIDENYLSYQISSLYAPATMFPWSHYAGKYVEANPDNAQRNEYKMQVFNNTCLGLTHVPLGEAPKATMIMGNVQDYEVGMIPESLSIAHGNGKIVLLTAGIDLNGKMKSDIGNFRSDVDDARLDYAIYAHTESGATYAIKHGSIGTFKPLGGNDEVDKPESGVNRVRWTYQHNVPNSVWPELERILLERIPVDTGGTLPIGFAAIDCGVYAVEGAYPFLDKTNADIVGVKGSPDDNWLDPNKNIRTFKPALERPADLYILEVGILKDRLSARMRLNYDPINQRAQPDGFMNFPHASSGQFEYTNFYSHFESEQRIAQITKSGKSEMRWKKVNSAAQNHMFDCCLYAMVARDILVSRFELKGKDRIVNLDWKTFAQELIKAMN